MSTTLSRPISSSIIIVEKSNSISIAKAIYVYFLGMTRRNFSMAFYSSMLSSPCCVSSCTSRRGEGEVIDILRVLEHETIPLLA
jgi:hypothetical protein